MKIALFDSWNCKFTAPLVRHWQDGGHEVIINPLWERMAETDINVFYPADSAIVEASTTKIPHKGKIFVNCIDIEVWAGQATAVDWSYVDGLTFISQHIHDYVMQRIVPPHHVKIILPGINIEKFPLKPEKQDNINRMAYVVGDRRIWDVKRFDVVLMMLREMLDQSGDGTWQLHVLGSYSSHVQYNDYCESLLDSLNLRNYVFWYDRQEDVSAWLDPMDFFVLPSTKEAFSYATAEAMAKGIIPVIGNWRGAVRTWGPFVSLTYFDMIRHLQGFDNQPGERGREYVIQHYSEERYFKELDEFIGLEGGERHD